MAPRPATIPRCGQCRRKKIKCDYVQPQCGRCVRSKLECTPYKGQIVFVEHLPRPSTSTEQQQWALVPSSSQSLARSVSSSSSSSGSSGSYTQYRHWQAPSARTLTGSPFLAGKFTRASSFGEFLMQYVPDEFRKPGETCITWITTVQKHQELSPSTDAGVHALGLIVKGKVTRDSSLIAQSMRMYGVAVARLRSELLNAASGSYYKALVSTMVLLQYENLSASMQLLQGYTSYGSGIASTLKMIKPASFQDGEAHSVFLHCRAVLIMTDVLYGRNSFITDDEWSTVPFKNNPKAPFHLALDVLAKIPPVSNLGRSLPGATESDVIATGEWGAYNQEWRQLDDEFVRWLDNVMASREPFFKISYEERSDSRSLSRSSSDSDWSSNDDYSEVYVYRVLEDAASMMTCWTGRLMLLQSMREVAQSSQLQISAMAYDVIEQQKGALLTAAEGILRTIPYCLRSSSGVVGMQTMVLPLRNAMAFFEFADMPDQLAQCNQFAAQLAAKELNLGRTHPSAV